MSADECLIVEIQGVAAASGAVARYCYPEVPDYGDTDYNTGIADPPTGVGSRWEVLERQISIGQVRVRLFAAVGPINWYQQTPRPITRLTAEEDTASTSFDHERTNTIAGIAANDVLYINRETLLVSTATGGNAFFAPDTTGSRNKAGSVLQTHALGSLVYASPPAFKGREVTIYRGPRTGGSTGDETVIGRGYIAKEPAADLWFCDLIIQERFGDSLLNKNPRPWNLSVDATGDQTILRPGFPRTQPEAGFVAADINAYFNDSGPGAYFFVPDLELVAAIGRSDQLVTGVWEVDQRSIWQTQNTEGNLNVGEWAANLIAYQVVWSSQAGPYPTFGYDDSGFVASDNPIDIVLNLLVSTEAGGNAASGRWDWDRGDLLAPDFSLQIDESRIDWDAFERARAELEIVHADMLWLGGPDTLRADEVFDRLLGIWGYAVGSTRSGQWTVIRLADVYPSDSPVAITQDDIAEPERTAFSVVGRPLDEIILGLDTGPDGDSRHKVRVVDLTSNDLYPPNVGDETDLDGLPYSSGPFLQEGSSANALVGLFLHRFAGRIASVEVTINDRHIDAVDVGVAVTLLDLIIPDPTTGTFLTLSDGALGGVVTSVASVDLHDSTARVTVMLTDTGNVAAFSAAAEVASWNGTDKIATCDSQQVTTQGTDDCERFAVGDRVMLLDADGTLRSDDGTAQTLPVVDAVTATTLDLDTDFLDTGGSTVTPADGDWIVYAAYDGGVTATQTTNYAFAADEGPGTTTPAPSLGAAADAPYVYGD